MTSDTGPRFRGDDGHFCKTIHIRHCDESGFMLRLSKSKCFSVFAGMTIRWSALIRARPVQPFDPMALATAIAEMPGVGRAPICRFAL